MLVFSIEKDEIKSFMNKLFIEDVFDKLEVRFFEVETIVKYEITGNINKDYLEEDEKRYFVKWKELKPYVHNIIKGRKKPKYIKMVFSLADDEVSRICETAQAMFLNITYNNDEITGTTGTSQKFFSISKLEDKIWEDVVLKFFSQNYINITIQE